MSPQIILASTSPYRRQLLARILPSFQTASPETDESEIPGEPPDARALRLAEEKALSVANQFPGALIIGGDQTISSDGEIFDKPGTPDRAEKQLRRMRGRPLHFHTAVAVCRAGIESVKTESETVACEMQSRLVMHRARLRAATDAEIARYVKREPALNCAGGAQIEGLGIAMMSEIRGADPTALIGVPLIPLSHLLRRSGVPIP